MHGSLSWSALGCLHSELGVNLCFPPPINHSPPLFLCFSHLHASSCEQRRKFEKKINKQKQTVSYPWCLFVDIYLFARLAFSFSSNVAVHKGMATHEKR